MQTNGTLLNSKWMELFKKHNYLIGISLDGYKEIHDVFRKSARNKGTFDQVMKATELLKFNKIDFNILCFINKLVAQNG